ncbi:MAG: hypothetical protein IPQ24_09955 [Anaeromyxobacter sp.]|nr:hypothetical protein [Anaeromyxobacter sp.]
MSHAPDSQAHPRAEDDHVEVRTVLLVGLGALLIFAVAGVAAGLYLQRTTAARPAAGLPAELGQTKIALVEQRLFHEGNVLRADRDRAARLARLAGAGWVDRARGVAHIPIEDAMALVAAGQRVPPASPPVAPPVSAIRGGVDAPSVPVAAPAAAPPAAPARGPARTGGAR